MLTADLEIIRQRLTKRGQHFMKAGMLGSQLAALQWPADAIVVDVAGSVDASAAEVTRCIRSLQAVE